MKRIGWVALIAPALLALHTGIAGANPAPAPTPIVSLSPAQQAYRAQVQAIHFCVDPDWRPFEVIEGGQHVGIAADLLALVAQRTGLPLRLLPTPDWPASLQAAQAGRCQVISLLNQTPARDAWLIFTRPILSDDNILITREDHPFVVDLASLQGQTLVLPKGTSIEERVRRDFPHVRITLTDSEAQALAMVSERKADFTMRSLIVAAYTIKREGWFNLKIAGQVPGYGNQLRIGVRQGDTMLRDILDLGVASISAAERQQVVDRHITITTGIDTVLVRRLVAVFVLILLTSLFWMRKLHRARQAAEQTTEQQRKFIAMLSHEVRTPLAVIDAAAQVLVQRLPAASEHLPPIQRIRRGVARLSHFFENSLTADRLGSDNFTVQPASIDLAQLAAWAQKHAALLSAEHAVQVELEPDLPALWGDLALLRILLANLLSNALKYAPADSPVTMRVQRQGLLCYLSVTDSGPGIPQDEQERIFQKYQRGRLAQSQPGAGLGLSVVRRIATLHGGRVSVQSQPGHGACFVVELPFRPDSA